MSKAFKSDDGEGDSDPLEFRSDKAPSDAGVRNYITPGGFERMREELKRLLYTERPSVVQTVSWAASNGDRSENGDYIYGKRRLREIDRRIRFLNRRLDAAQVIDPTTQKSQEVLFGATVRVRDSQGAEKTYCIVGIDETDPKNGRISWISPLAKALLRAKAGDVVSFREELEIIEVSYVELK